MPSNPPRVVVPVRSLDGPGAALVFEVAAALSRAGAVVQVGVLSVDDDLETRLRRRVRAAALPDDVAVVSPVRGDLGRPGARWRRWLEARRAAGSVEPDPVDACERPGHLVTVPDELVPRTPAYRPATGSLAHTRTADGRLATRERADHDGRVYQRDLALHDGRPSVVVWADVETGRTTAVLALDHVSGVVRRYPSVRAWESGWLADRAEDGTVLSVVADTDRLLREEALETGSTARARTVTEALTALGLRAANKEDEA